MSPAEQGALFRYLPQLRGRVPWVSLGMWPTPITAHEVLGRTLWVKHEGDSHPVYGGNKLRTLEAWLGHARALGVERIWAVGAYGSNHAIATALHAPTAGLTAGAILFPQPRSTWAMENAGALIASGIPLVRLRSVIEVVGAGTWVARRERRAGVRAIVMPPGGATPVGTFGALSAAFELAEQVERGALPPPRVIVLPIGSTCTSAGLLAGLALAAHLGTWRGPVPTVHAVRVTPWPVTSRLRTAHLAWRTVHRLAALLGRTWPISLGALRAGLTVDGRELGGGYGRSTAAGDRAAASLPALRIDSVYAAKAAAAALWLLREGTGPVLFWASKSTATLPPPDAAALAAAPRVLADWITSYDPRSRA